MSSSLPKGWEEKELCKVANITMGQSPKSSSYNEKGEGEIFYQGVTDFGELYPSIKKYTTEPKKIAIKGDILFSVRAPVGTLNIANNKCCIGRGISSLSMKNNENRFLFYLLKYNQTVFENLATGTTFTAVNKKDIETFEVKLPSDKNEQKRIADILSAFDDKIEINNKINQSLEEMACAIFKEWFENFNFPNSQGKAYKDNGGEMKSSELGEIPIDWDIKKFDDLFDITSSKRVFRDDYVEDGVPFYRSKEVILKSNGQDITDCLYISEEKFEDIKSKYDIPKRGEILLTSVGTLGVPYLVGDEEFYFKDGNLTWFKNFKFESLNLYIYIWLKYGGGKKSLDEIVIGSTQKALTITALKNIKVVFSEEQIKLFIAKTSDLIQQIQQNIQQNQILKQQRDILLPKLMSGEIRV